jgi:lipopolysaccharide transport system ATP-binding protein
MSSRPPAIRVENLGKCYQVYANPKDRLRQAIMPRLRAFGGFEARQYYREFWALRGVSLAVAEGETVGIIGRNGSGKSTLLQMICGTLDPTEGVVETQGRVAALLELGAGFNPEFTGRENVFMNASVLGLEDEEIADRFDDIAAFADIGEFIDQPVKHYSSGMYARLAFAVAISVDPRILIVDEALSVGDEPFQRKCFARIEQIKSDGGSILLVSHTASTVVSLCDRAILLHAGERLFTGPPKVAVSWYQKLMNAPTERFESICAEIRELDRLGKAPDEAASDVDRDATGASAAPAGEAGGHPGYDPTLVSKSMVVYETKGARISNPRILDLDGRQVNQLQRGERYRVCYEVTFERDVPAVRYRCLIKTINGVELGGGTYPEMRSDGVPALAGDTVQVVLEFNCNLETGTYFLNCGLQDHFESLHRILDALVFRVESANDSHSFGLVDFGFVSQVMPATPGAAVNG